MRLVTAISLVVPSRARPVALAEMLESAAATAADPDSLEAVVVIDDDDPAQPAYHMAALDSGLDCTVLVVPRAGHSDLWNRGAEAATGRVLMLAADDIRFRSAGWDASVMQVVDEPAYADGVLLVYGRDGVSDGATHPWVTRTWVDAVGRFTAPHFVGDYADLWLWEVAKQLGRAVYLGDVLVEHMHYSVGKGARDITHDERLARMAADPPVLVWEATVAEREAEVEVLRALMRP